MAAMKRGVVSEFDAHVGLGVVRGDDGVSYPFHCTKIANGSRVVPVGATVEFDTMAGMLGHYEACTISVLDAK